MLQKLDRLLACLGDLCRERGGAGPEGPHDPLHIAHLALGSGLFSDGAPSDDTMRIELHDAMIRHKASLELMGVPEPRPYSMRWYHARGGDPVSSSGTITVRQYCYGILWHKMYAKGLNKGVDFLCSWLSGGGLLPPDNIAPR